MRPLLSGVERSLAGDSMAQENETGLPSDLRQFAGLGLPLTTLATVGLYFVGANYYDGYFGFWGLEARDVSVEFLDLVRPSRLTIVMLWQVALGYAGLRQGIRLVRAARAPDQEPAVEGRYEAAFGWIISAVWLVSIGWSIWRGSSIAWTALAGAGAGTLFAFARDWKWTVHKMVLLGLSFVGLCAHARYAGGRDALALILKKDVVFTLQSDAEVSMKPLYSSSSGTYGLRTSPGDMALEFLPQAQIKGIKYPAK